MIISTADNRRGRSNLLTLCGLPLLVVRVLMLHIHHQGPVIRQYLPKFILRLFTRYEHVLLRPADYFTKSEWIYRHYLPRRGIHMTGDRLFSIINGEVLTLDETHQLVDSIDEGGYTLAVGTCPCRRARREISDVVPNNTDMVLGRWADEYIRNYPRLYHAIDREKAHRLVEEFDRYGFIHNVYGVLDVAGAAFVVCNCDPTVCIPYEAQMTRDYQAFRKGRSVAYVNADSCLGVEECGVCLSRCHFGARSEVKGKARVDPELCYGCGLCVSTCSGGATRLKMKKGSKFIYVEDFVD